METHSLIERLRRKNEDGSLAEITEEDQQAAADAIERLTQIMFSAQPPDDESSLFAAEAKIAGCTHDCGQGRNCACKESK